MGQLRLGVVLRLWIKALLIGAFLLDYSATSAEMVDREELASRVMPPFSLGDEANDKGVWNLLNSGGAHAGYVFQTEPLAPLPGFSGAVINVMVTLDLEGRFLEAQLINHNEPIFVSGLGEAPFNKFFEQYRGHSISSSLVIGTPYGEGNEASSLVYLDGVTKATASVRIAHESILAATLAVAREKMQGIATGPPAYPDPNHEEDLTWQDLVDQGLATRKLVTNTEIQKAFDGTLWETDDPEVFDAPDEAYLDLWIVDLGPKSIARAALGKDSYDELQDFLAIETEDEPILVIETGRHGLVSEDFVRNTSPDWLSMEQDGLPIALRDADLWVETAPGVPEGVAMILRTDRRLGLDPSRKWKLTVLAVRSHGSFQPEIGTVPIEVIHATDERFFARAEVVKPLDPRLEALRNRAIDLVVLAVLLVGILVLVGPMMNRVAALRHYTWLRLGILAVTTGFIGWWGQGQLSIVTFLGALRTAWDGGSYGFLLYDPFSLVIWGVTIVSFFIWGRAFFCGWLCPFGALQEFANHIGRLLKLPKITVRDSIDRPLRGLKYVLLAGLIVSVFVVPDEIDLVAEIEPFKTAITVFFVREWYYVAYAAFWLVLGLFFFKGFCRYVCPLGALMAVGGLLRRRDWIPRRIECGSPCQLCRVKCDYGAIRKTGEIDYKECFQCLDCVRIHDSPKECVPLILKDKAARRAA